MCHNPQDHISDPNRSENLNSLYLCLLVHTPLKPLPYNMFILRQCTTLVSEKYYFVTA